MLRFVEEQTCHETFSSRTPSRYAVHRAGRKLDLVLRGRNHCRRSERGAGLDGVIRNEQREKAGKKLKGRDIGYALAANSCEGVNRVDASTVTAP